MTRAKHILATCLAAILMAQGLAPSTAALAEEIEVVEAAAGALTAAAPNEAAEGEGAADSESGAASGAAEVDAASALADDDPLASSSGEDEAAALSNNARAEGIAASGETGTASMASAWGDASDAEDASNEPMALSSNDAAVAVVSVTYDYTTLADLKAALGNDGSVTTSADGTAAEITFNTNDALKKISRADPSLYANATIKVSGATGAEFDLSTASGEACAFQGFGSADAPFAGTIVDASNNPLELTVDRTLYNGLKLTGSNGTIKIKWKGAADYAEPMIAASLATDGDDTRTLDAAVTIIDPADTTGVVESTGALTTSLVGTSEGDVKVNASYAFGGTRKALSVNASTDIGLLARSVESGTFTVGTVSGLDGSVAGSDGARLVKTDSGNAGLYVGSVADGAVLCIGAGATSATTSATIPEITVQSTAGAAGGAAGLVGTSSGAGATVAVAASALDLTNLTIKGTAASGGFIGQAYKLTLSYEDGAGPVTCAGTVGASNSKASGGFIGDVSFAKDPSFGKNSQVSTGTAGVTLAAAASAPAGAVLGNLRWDDSGVGVTFNGGIFTSVYGNGGSTASYGGLIGATVGCTTYSTEDSSLAALTVKDVTTNYGADATTKFTAGLVGWLGKGGNGKSVYLRVEGATTKCTAAGSSSNGLGGVVGCVDHFSVLDIQGLTATTSGEVSMGAGVAAESWDGVIRLAGVTDFSGMSFSANNNTAQIARVACSDPTLVFAPGTGSDSVPTDSSQNYWAYKRCGATEIDDLGQCNSKGYGEVIRLDGTKLAKDLIKIDGTTHKVTGPSTSDWSWQVGSGNGNWSSGNRTLTIGSVQDFAAYAITVQVPKLWNGMFGLAASNASQLMGSDVVLNITADIDLSGTGITGIGYDVENGNSTSFTGTINGGGHTISLAIGEPYGMRGDTAIGADDNTAGNGRIYRHTALGLVAKDGGSTVNNLVIGGTINVKCAIKNMNIGGYAALKAGGTTTFTGLTSKPTVTLTQDGKTSHFGYVCGRVSGEGSVIFAAGGTTSGTASGTAGNLVQASLTSDGKMNGESTVGGVIGQVDNNSFMLNVNDLQVTGSMSVNADRDTLASGGLIGIVKSGVTKTVNLTKLDMSGLELSLTNAKSSAGGFLGYRWANTDVTFTGASADAPALKVGTGAELSVTNSSQKALGLGGLVYAASGVWTVGENALDLGAATIAYTGVASGSSLGLLVCNGGDDGNNLNGSLYLQNTSAWDSAYKVAGMTLPSASLFANFDEWVCDTRANASGKNYSGIADCGVNGVVSLRAGTTANGLDMSGDSAKRTSYVNRTDVGQTKATNDHSRYYYNLDLAAEAVGDSTDGYISTPAELLLWSVYKYADSNIRDNFAKADAATSNIIGAASGTADLDMTGYSYYPVDVADADLTVQNAKITFCYDAIKSEESGNKLNSAATQHMNMHAGLVRNFTCGTTAGRTLTVDAVELTGTVGADAENAGNVGAILGGSMAGTNDGGTTCIQTLTINNLTLNGLAVSGVNANTAYAPLLANSLGDYTALNVSGISMEGYTDGTTAATSLFGTLGTDDAKMVTGSFTNIAVEALKASSSTVLTRASLLESYAHADSASANVTYNFTEADRNADAVTFGSEIDSAGEYKGQQLWYYDQYGTKLVQDKQTNPITANDSNPQFGVYLPYVAQGHTGTKHEIKVNQRAANLTVGCGTYGDPYAIASAPVLYALASYINTAKANDGWVVTIASNQETICERRAEASNTDNEVTYQWSASQDAWVKGAYSAQADTFTAADDAGTLTNETMHYYLQSCYLSIEPAGSTSGSGDISAASATLEVDAGSFSGLGNATYPFRGVVVGGLVSGVGAATLKINSAAKLDGGLIPCSYGSVVKDLSIVYNAEDGSATKSVSYTEKNSTTGVPTAFWGGVIGCVLGGDNIIDGVAVSSGNGFTVAGSGDKGHLVHIGGYVGSIAGGGVIFRNSTSVSGALDAWHAQGDSYYDNPYVGRVIDGYAFSEGVELENTDRNYKVNQLDTTDTGCVTTGDTYKRYRDDGDSTEAPTTTVNDAQGLLVLSAIINSGAGAGSAYTSWSVGRGSRAYEGRGSAYNSDGSGYKFGNDEFGKVRNATYAYVGKPGEDADDADFGNSNDDDLWAPGAYNGYMAGGLDTTDGYLKINSSYLVKKYATDWRTGYVCAWKVSGMDLRFVAGENYDMTSYGNGFLGLSGRYFSNACYATYGQGGGGTYGSVSDESRDFITPGIACINGNGATIKVSRTFREYTDDDYQVAGVGGLFGTINFYKNIHNSASITNNGGNVVWDLTFQNCEVDFKYLGSDSTTTTSYNDSSSDNLGVGILAGSTANREASDGSFSGVAISGGSVSGGPNAGGLLGSSGYMSRSSDTSSTTWIVNTGGGAKSSVKLYDCSYSGLTVSARKNAGGFVGKLASGEGGIWVTGGADLSVASNSTITVDGTQTDRDRYCTAGGFVGLTGATTSVNTDQDSDATQRAVLSDVTIQVDHSSRGIGGLVGRAESTVVANRVTVTSSKQATGSSPTYFGTLETDKLVTQYYSDEAKRGPVGVGGMVGSANQNATFNSCLVQNIRIGAGEDSAGFVGALGGNYAIAVSNSTVSGLQFDGARSGGVVGSTQDKASSTTTVSNFTVKDCTFASTSSWWTSHGGGNGGFSGGIAGAACGAYQLANVLIDNNTFAKPARQGLLIGDTPSGSSTKLAVYAAGVDVRLASGTTKDTTPWLINYFNRNDTSYSKAVNQRSYIALANYNDAELDSEPTSALYGGSDTDDATAAASPYVAATPVSGIKVRNASDGEDRSLYGDGANVGLAATIMAATSAGTSEGGQYVYTNIGGIGSDGQYQSSTDFSETASVGTFNDNNSGSRQMASDKDFHALVLSGNGTDTIKNYLNIVTNGGFSDAVRLNASGTQHVTASVGVFALDGSGNLVKDADPSDQALTVVGNGTASMSFRANANWDNGKGRVNILTVAFTEAGQSFKVHVPVIVKRELQIDFTATYHDGTDFKVSNYNGYKDHVLSNFGEPMTGYLTWVYNQNIGVASEFGWDTYLAAGGSMKALGKTLEFKGTGDAGTLPAGTQLTLIDCAGGDAAYTYTVGSSGATSVALSAFTTADGSASYAERWMSDLMGVTATEDAAGTWIVCDSADEAGASATLNGVTTYFKVAGASDAGARYTLTVEKSGGKEATPSESFYLSIYVPSSATTSSSAVNGYTGTSLSGASAINHKINYKLRAGGQDTQQNTASTYSIYSSYTQVLSDEVGSADSRQKMTKADGSTSYSLELNVDDTISFNKDQAYSATDKLYYRLDVSLARYGEDGNVTESGGFPVGCSGTVAYYVTVGDTYYTWNGGSWAAASGEASAAEETWQSDGGSMTLAPGFDLAGIRTIASASGQEFHVRARIEKLLVSDAACQAAIPASSSNGSDAYAKLVYRASLATSSAGLASTSLVANTGGNVGYYREATAVPTIQLLANDRSQLGINLNDLAGKGNGTISVTGIYDFAKANGGSELVEKARTVVYALSLQKRGSSGYESVSGIGEYLSVAVLVSGLDGVASADGKSITWTDSADSSADLKTRDGAADTFKLPLVCKVSTDVESQGHTYANYRLVLTAQAYDENGYAIGEPVNVDGNTSTYAHSDYVTYTLTKVKLDGYTS